ncbi:MAG: FHA domain-containing protein [Sandaracinaceae bacterium]|nr:FHA domain-containing protein [Sandaracinaceae bacterium]
MHHHPERSGEGAARPPPRAARALRDRAGGERCEVVLADADASREHAELEIGLEGVTLRDLGSKNGVVVGGRAVRERLLGDGDELRIGATVLRFDDPAGERVRALEQGDDEAASLPDAEPAEPEPEAAEPAAEPALEPPEEPPAPPPPPKASIAPADMVIYVLAAAVFALSVLGLLWLLRAS